ncbi:MAG: metallophosphoesterase [Thermoleophilia bacterium]|nr:metallophosphoesterase [Thermoleophilia bacterium]
MPSSIMRYLLAVLTIFLAAVAAYYSLILVSPTELTVGPVRAEFSMKAALHGKTVVDLPPAGTIEADTHSSPAVVSYSLKEISVNEVDDLISLDSEARAQLENWREPVRREAWSLIFKVSMAAMLTGGAVAGVLHRRWQWAVAGIATGLATVLLVGGLAYGTYDMNAFSEPRYSGSLTYAPEVLAFSQETLANLDEYENRVPEIADSLYRTVSALHQLPQGPPEEDTIRVLHVSDMHSSAAAAGLVRTAAELYDIDFVVDTGDLTDLGTSLEMRYPSTYLPMKVPYLWIAGNHDTPTITDTMETTPGVTVLSDDFVEQGGVLVGGFADPASLSASPAPSSDGRLAQEAARIAGIVDIHSPKPFMVAVHDPKQAARLDGKVPVVLNGHTHRESVVVENGTVFLDAGSTGGGGFRSFNHNGESPSSLQVLYIRKDPMKLVAVDSISIYGYSQEFSVKRRVFAADEGILRETEIREAQAALTG